jgi:hypothetical protein
VDTSVTLQTWWDSQPAWFRYFVEKFPKNLPTNAQLIEIYHDALEASGLPRNPHTGYAICPVCTAPAADFKYNCHRPQDEDDEDFTWIECPHCHWDTEV